MTRGPLTGAAPAAGRPPAARLARVVPYALSAALGLAIWYAISLSIPPVFFPAPRMVLETAWRVVTEGTLLLDIGASLARILAGFGVGTAVGALVGLLIGTYAPVRFALEPYTEFFRFIPGIAMTGLATVWFGTGEVSRVFLTFFATVFPVIINTEAGVRSVEPNRVRAALCLGATRVQVFTRVVVPSSTPMILVGMRIAMGFSIATIISAELLGAQSGLGFMIASSRLFMQTDRMFVAILTLGILGLCIDALFRALIRRFAGRYVARA